MGSSTKRRTTMAMLNRDNKLREQRIEKEARKHARRLSQAHADTHTDRLRRDGDALPRTSGA